MSSLITLLWTASHARTRYGDGQSITRVVFALISVFLDWRNHRREIHRELNVNQLSQYNYIQEREAYTLMRSFLERGADDFIMIVQRFAGSIGMGALCPFPIGFCSVANLFCR